MRKSTRAIILVVVTLLSAAVLGVASTTTPAISLAAVTKALIMGGTGRPNPADFPGYIPNVASYYIYPNTVCQPDNCDLVSVFTPETAWPLYGGLSALTWKDSILQGVTDFDAAFQQELAANPDGHFVLFGYSQSGEILAIEKQALANAPVPQDQIEIVVIGNSSRPNGGIDSRIPFSIPIVNFPFGPPMPTDTQIKTTDIGFRWDPISDLPLYVLNPIAMLNALLGFEFIHGTFPDPTAASPDSTPGGYSVAEWQAIMDDPEAFAAAHPDLVDVQTFGDTRYVTVTPKVLPLVMPLHSIGLTPLADLIEPALRVFIEQTGYDRSIPFGQPTPFRLIPIFNPFTLAADLAGAAAQGVQDAMGDLGGSPLGPLAPLAPASPSILAGANIGGGPASTGLQSNSTTSGGAQAASGKPGAGGTTAGGSSGTGGQNPLSAFVTGTVQNGANVLNSGNKFVPGILAGLTGVNGGQTAGATTGGSASNQTAAPGTAPGGQGGAGASGAAGAPGGQAAA